MAAADSHLENGILDVWSIIMNKTQLTRETTHPSRFFFTTYVYVSHTCWHMLIITLNVRENQAVLFSGSFPL